MELEWGDKTYYIEWDSFEEVYVTDEDGNDVPYEYELYERAYRLVWEHYYESAQMMMER